MVISGGIYFIPFENSSNQMSFSNLTKCQTLKASNLDLVDIVWSCIQTFQAKESLKKGAYVKNR